LHLELFAFLGPNGAEKTTTLEVVSGSMDDAFVKITGHTMREDLN